jgi:UDPglucose--hexose-1-phosphate uridylyltransferase
MLVMPQRDITPESAAERLRSLSDLHYKRSTPQSGSVDKLGQMLP